MKSAPILIIDKIGLIGEPLALKLSKEFPVVFVSRKSLEPVNENSNIIHVPFWRKFPVIPDNKYSHIVVIEEDGLNLEFLPKVIEKAKDTNSEFIFALGLFSKGEYLINKVLNAYLSSKVVLYGDVFDNKLIHRGENFKSVINKFIYQAQRFQRIQILGDGLSNVYPVFIDDVVDGLIDIVFGLHNSHSLFYIFPKHPTSELSLAHMIQKANPQILIDFIKYDDRKEIISYPSHGKYLLETNYTLAKKIRKIDVKKTIIPPQNESPQEQMRGIKHFPFFIVWILFFLVFAPLVFTLIFSFLGLNTLYFAKKEIDKGSLVNAKSALHLSQAFFYIGRKASDILVLQGRIIGRERQLKRLVDDIDLGHKISEGAMQAFNSWNYFAKVFTGTSKDPIGDFTKGKNNLKSAIVLFERIKAEGKIPAPFIEKIKNIDPFIKLLSNTTDVMPSIFGLEGQKTYLVLFQNNMELRPGGGFIGSYGILKLNMGKITDFSIHDVYDADGQLRGHVEPPFAIRRHLPTNHWYMRDSNFDVDFVKSASSSSNFLDIETGQKVDGVIGVDVSFVKNILEALGPVYVANYKETVDKNNLYMLTQVHSEKNFFPGSTQKKDFLRSLYKAIMTKISREDVPYLMLAQAISDSLMQKHLIFAFNDNIQNIFTVNGWSSSLWDERKDNTMSINDFLGINEANLGVNKVNYFISRQVSQNAIIDNNGNVSGAVTIRYKNASTAWPGGDYKNYLRIILPLGAQLSSISINDISQVLIDAVTDPLIYEAKNFKAPIGLEVEKTSEENKTIYGFIVKVPVGGIVKVKIQYNLAKKIDLALSAFSYNLRLFKQPGIDSVAYSFSLSYQNSFNIIKNSEGIITGKEKIFYSEKITGDRNLIIDFAKK